MADDTCHLNAPKASPRLNSRLPIGSVPEVHYFGFTSACFRSQSYDSCHNSVRIVLFHTEYIGVGKAGLRVFCKENNNSRMAIAPEETYQIEADLGAALYG